MLFVFALPREKTTSRGQNEPTAPQVFNPSLLSLGAWAALMADDLLLAFMAGFYGWLFQLVVSDPIDRVFSTSVSYGVI